MMSLLPHSDHDLIEIADLCEAQYLDDTTDDNRRCGRKVRTTIHDKDCVAFFDATFDDQIIARREAINWWKSCGESAFNNVAPCGSKEF